MRKGPSPGRISKSAPYPHQLKGSAALMAALCYGDATGLAYAEQLLARLEPEGQDKTESVGTRSSSVRAVDPDASTDDIFRQMFGTEAPIAPKLDYPVRVVGMNRGDVEIAPGRSAEETLVDREGIVTVLSQVISADRLTELVYMSGNRSSIPLTDLNRLGYNAVFDTRDLTLIVDVPLDYQDVIPIPLQERSRYAPPTDLLTQADTSGIVNFFGGTNYVWSNSASDTGFDATQVNIEAVINHRGLVLETGALYASEARQSFIRNDTRLTYDFVDSMIRTQLGDLNPRTAGLQGNPIIGGFTAHRELRIQPEANVRANPSEQFELQRNARVSVIVNGQFVRELRLEAGRYNLSDLPLRSGAGNDVELEIVYDSGEIERIVFSAFFDFELLRPGFSEFAFSAGPTSSIRDDRRVYDTDNIAASGFYRLGISDRLTAGVNGQADNSVYQIGAEALYASPIGTMGVFVAHSDGDSGPASAATLLYRINGGNSSRQSVFNLQAQYAELDFRSLRSNLPSTFEYNVAARFATNLDRATRVQASLGYQKLHLDGATEYSAVLNGSRQIGRGSLSLSAGYTDRASESGWNVGVSYTMRLGRANAQIGHNTADQATRAGISYQPDFVVGALGYDAAYTRQKDIDNLRAGVGYVGNRFDGRVEQQVTRGNGFNSSATNLFGGTAVVYADRKIALSRPVFDSFAIFTLNDESNEFGLAVEPNGGTFDLPTGYSAKSSILGPAVLADLQSYQVRTVVVEAPDAPPGYSVGSDAFTFRPGLRSGYNITVGSDRNVAVIGTLVLPNGDAASFASGYVTLPNGERQFTFSNAGGRFYIENVKAGETIRVDFDKPKGAWVELRIPKESVGVFRIEGETVLNLPVELAPLTVAAVQTAGEP